MKNERGQVSFEFILIVGLVLLMVVTIMPYAMAQHEFNRAIAAARDGAQLGAAMIGLGYKPPDSTFKANNTGPIKIVGMRYEYYGKLYNRSYYNITLRISGPPNTKILERKEIAEEIEDESRRFMNMTFSGKFQHSLRIFTSRYYFQVSYELV